MTGGPLTLSGWAAHPTGICAVSWAHDGRRLATGGNDGHILIWEYRPGAGVLLASLIGHQGSVRTLAWSPDDRLLASGAEDGTVAVWELDTGRRVTVPQRDRCWVNAVAWSPDGRWLAAAGGDRRLVVTDPAGEPVAGPLHSPYGVFLGLAWSPDGTALAATGRGPVITVWDTANWTVRDRLDAGPGAVWTVCWLPWLAAGGGPAAGGLASGNAIGQVRLSRPGAAPMVIDGHGGAVARVTASRTGDLLASLSHDQTIAVWDARTGRLAWRHRDAYPGWTGCLEASPADDLLAGTDSTGREVRIWPLVAEAAGGTTDDVPVDAWLRAAVAEARHAGRDWMALPALSRDLAARYPRLRRPEGWVAAALARLAARGDVELAGDQVLAGFDPPRVHRLAEAAVARTCGDGVVDLREVVPAVLATGLGPDCTRVLAGLVGCHLVATGRAWITGTSTAHLLCAAGALPERPPPAATEVEVDAVRLRWAGALDGVFADVLGTTLFRRWAAWRGGLLVVDADGTPLWVTADDAGLAVTVAAHRTGHRDLIAALIERRLSRGCPADQPRQFIRVVRPLPGDLRPWDPPAIGPWALDPTDLPDDHADAVAVLDEHVDDERRRQERLVLGATAARVLGCDALIWHLPADREAAAEFAAELEVLGLRAKLGANDPSSLVDASLRARVAVLLVTPAMRDWAGTGPLAAGYAELTRRTTAAGRRVRWLPVLAPGAAVPAGLPDHLHSFDWFSRRPLRALVGGILVDRTRS